MKEACAIANTILIVLATGFEAKAADVASAVQVKAPRFEQAYDWSGLYVGGTPVMVAVALDPAPIRFRSRAPSFRAASRA